MKKLFVLFMLISIPCFAQKVEISREIVTNNISPHLNMYGIYCMTNILFCATNSYVRGWGIEIPELDKARSDLDKANRRIEELTYPKNSHIKQWIWSNTVYQVSEKDQSDVLWTSSVCIATFETDTVISQKIKTNVTTKITSLLPAVTDSADIIKELNKE